MIGKNLVFLLISEKYLFTPIRSLLWFVQYTRPHNLITKFYTSWFNIISKWSLSLSINLFKVFEMENTVFRLIFDAIGKLSEMDGWI